MDFGKRTCNPIIGSILPDVALLGNNLESISLLCFIIAPRAAVYVTETIPYCYKMPYETLPGRGSENAGGEEPEKRDAKLLQEPGLPEEALMKTE